MLIESKSAELTALLRSAAISARYASGVVPEGIVSMTIAYSSWMKSPDAHQSELDWNVAPCAFSAATTAGSELQPSVLSRRCVLDRRG